MSIHIGCGLWKCGKLVDDNITTSTERTIDGFHRNDGYPGEHYSRIRVLVDVRFEPIEPVIRLGNVLIKLPLIWFDMVRSAKIPI